MPGLTAATAWAIQHSACAEALEANYLLPGPTSRKGSATQVMLTIQIRATVGQKQSCKQRGQQQPCSSERRVQRVDQAGTRKMAIPAMGSRIISVKRANASLVPWPTTAS